MVGHYERRWSSAAVWCERIASISIPFFAIAILLHRLGEISTPQVVWLGAAGLAMLLTSLFLGMRAVADLWTRGLRGGKRTVRGVIITLLLLTPFIWHGYLAVEHPMLSHVGASQLSGMPLLLESCATPKRISHASGCWLPIAAGRSPQREAFPPTCRRLRGNLRL